jgi:hypothetical protein
LGHNQKGSTNRYKIIWAIFPFFTSAISVGPEISTDPNAESARATQEGAQNLNKDVADGVNASNKASLGGANLQPSTSAQREGTNSNGGGQKLDEGNSGRDENENRETGQRRSIISSIRCVSLVS